MKSNFSRIRVHIGKTRSKRPSHGGYVQVQRARWVDSLLRNPLRRIVAIYMMAGFGAGLMVGCLVSGRSGRVAQAGEDVVDGMSDHLSLEEYHRDEDLVARELARRVRVLCLVLTSPKFHDSRARHVKATWGRRCNTLLFASSAGEPSLPTVAFDVPDTHDNLTQKVAAGFRHVREHHSADYDWVLKADDDTYVIMENLRYLLYRYNSSEPLYFGCRFKKYARQGYMSGGAGYVLSREAVDRLVYRAFPSGTCRTDERQEDVQMGRCLEDVGVVAVDTRDRYQRGRFFPFDLETVLLPRRTPDWYHSYVYYNSTDTHGMACCSDVAVSFHYIAGAQMYVLEYLLYHLRPYGITRPDTLDLLGNASQPAERDTSSIL